ncbi:MAG: hypothetical protein DI587_14555 [Variovorax paradoxus]|nr:MAG: hypothetical protein DI583_14555 [Variovorax paradoxus]PZQ09634.1 MAG: hypothetical protein DI587_14555 [Variovorax paradoxus]
MMSGTTLARVLDRRAALRAGVLPLLTGAVWPASAGSLTVPTKGQSVHLYPPHETRRLDAAATMQHAVTSALRDQGPRAPVRPGAALRRPPAAFEQTAARYGIPAWLMYGVALQESQLTIGRTALPYPWTLNVGGRPERHRDEQAARAALRRYLRAGLTNVDCGPMQLNWRWHRDRLQTVERALDPYINLDVGAQLLADLRRTHGDWRLAIQLYHAGSLTTAERLGRAQRYLASVERRLQRHGHTLADAIAWQPDGAGARRV